MNMHTDPQKILEAERKDTYVPLSRPLSKEEREAFAAELDALRRTMMAQTGEREASYIRRVRAMVRKSELAGRVLLMAGILPPAWLAGTTLLAFSKIVDNMELGHNVMHGQYDFMNDPEYQGSRFEWNNACDGDEWRHSHNYMHHTFTNIQNVDRDLGYGVLRLSEHEEWRPGHLIQPLYALMLAVFFQYGVALHDLELDRVARGDRPLSELKDKLPKVMRKLIRVSARDYLIFPALAGPFFMPVLLGNLSANLIRNLWAFAIIFCGHFTEESETYPESSKDSIDRGDWYLRQIRGSSNLEGGLWFHFMTGNLSHQIEHHLFPEIPAILYRDMAPKVREICARYGQSYNTGPFSRQFKTVVQRIFRFSLPFPVTSAARSSSLA